MQSKKPLPPGIHIILGDSAGGIFTRVFHARDRLLIDQDVLCCGPTPRCDDLKAWSTLRLEYWDHLVPEAIDEHVPSPDERSPKPLLKLSGDKKNMRHTEVALTPFGEAVLDRKASNYPTNPIDDWPRV